MNPHLSAFDYDEFEQFLLEAAKIDQAPADLPARVGVALGLGVPMVMASQAASLMPIFCFSSNTLMFPSGRYSTFLSSVFW